MDRHWQVEINNKMIKLIRTFDTMQQTSNDSIQGFNELMRSTILLRKLIIKEKPKMEYFQSELKNREIMIIDDNFYKLYKDIFDQSGYQEYKEIENASTL